ncbi:MAG: SCO family protein [Chloroflexi bacterium]|nr:SCO family protein [Chloroflexota bacterium]
MAIVAMVVALASAFMLYRARGSALVGTNLDSTPAPPIQLVDQQGQQVSLAQFRGRPVLLTFLYTQCPDACPLIADQVHIALNNLGTKGSEIGLLAVSTDPVHDNPGTATEFNRVHGLDGQLHYLLGAPSQLEPVWKSYYIGVSPGDNVGEVLHSEAVFLIDKKGNERVLLGVPFSASDLASDLEKLMSE